MQFYSNVIRCLLPFGASLFHDAEIKKVQHCTNSTRSHVPSPQHTVDKAATQKHSLMITTASCLSHHLINSTRGNVHLWITRFLFFTVRSRGGDCIGVSLIEARSRFTRYPPSADDCTVSPIRMDHSHGNHRSMYPFVGEKHSDKRAHLVLVRGSLYLQLSSSQNALTK